MNRAKSVCVQPRSARRTRIFLLYVVGCDFMFQIISRFARESKSFFFTFLLLTFAIKLVYDFDYREKANQRNGGALCNGGPILTKRLIPTIGRFRVD